MKKLLLIFLILFTLTACQEGFESPMEAEDRPSLTTLSDRTGNQPAEIHTDNNPAEIHTDNNPAEIHAGNISRIRIHDVSAALDTEYTDLNLIKEFCGLLENQKYTGTEKASGEAYKVELFDGSGNVALTAVFNDNTVYFDRSIAMGDMVLSEGTYEASDWSWTLFSPYLKQLCEGMVIDPEYIQYPASISIPASLDDIHKLEIVDKGNEKVNTYNVYPMLYDLVTGPFNSNSFEIKSSRKFYDYNELQSEIDRTKQESQCIVVTYGTSFTALPIRSRNGYKESSMAICLTIAKNPQEPDMYKLITDRMVFDIKVDSTLNDRFEALFSENGKSGKYVTPNEIKNLFNSKKPYFIEYICKNLGIDEWAGRRPDRLETSKMKLNSKSSPYTVVSLWSTFSLRMLVYKQNSAEDGLSFIGDMDFRGFPDSPVYRLERTGDQIWVAGIRYMGHGTGESHYSEQWYRITDTEVKPVLRFSFNDYIEGPYGGYSVNAKKVSVQQADNVKIIVDYDIAKRYNLFLDIADEYGSVELTGSKTVEFSWSKAQEKFISECTADEGGAAFTNLADSPEMMKKCDELLEKYDAELERIISEIPKEENAYQKTRKVESIRTFLNDCTDSPQKSELLKKLTGQ